MTACTWDPLGKNASVVLSGGNLTADCIGTQTCVRSTLGRDPASGGIWQAEFVVPGNTAGEDLRPIFGMCNASYAITTAAALGFQDVNAWGFYTGVQFVSPNGQFHNGVVGGNWDVAGGGTGGINSYYQLVWDASLKTLKIYRNGTLQLTSFTSVGTNGVLMYMAFGSGSAPAGHELVTANFDGPFINTIAGATAWGTPSAPVASFTRTPTSGAVPLSVAFTDTSTNAPTSWAWTFGDGSTSTSQNPTHVYAIPGQYTVTLTATNAGGSNTNTMTSAVLAGAITTQRPDVRLVGATYLAVTPSLLAISCIDTRQVVIANRSDGSIAGTTGDLGTWPGAVMYFQAALWYVTAAGNLVSMTNAQNPVTLTTTYTGAAVTGWITGTGSIIVAPGAAGGIVTLNTSGTILARIDGLLSQVQFAVASGAYVFAFDGRGNGAVVLVASSGGMTLVARFSSSNCQAITSGYVSGNSLILACSGRSDVVTIDISTPSAPVVGAPVSYAPDTLNAVLNDAAATPLTNEEQSTLGLAYWFPANAGSYQAGPVTYLVHARSGRLSLVSD